MEGLRLPMNLLPLELIDHVVWFLHPQEYIKLLNDQNFVTSNNNVCRSLAKSLTSSTHSLLYTNRHYDPFLGMYLLTAADDFLDKTKLVIFETISHFISVAKFISVHAEEPVLLNLSYYIWHLADLSELQEIIEDIGHLDNLKFSIELEFDPGSLYLIRLETVLSDIILKNVKNLTQLMVVNYSGDFLLDMTQFATIEKLWLENTDVKLKSSFRSNNCLDTLVLYPNSKGYSSNKPITLSKSLPENIRNVVIGNCIINSKSFQYPLPATIEKLLLINIKDNTDKWIPDLLRRSFQHNLKYLTINNVLLTDKTAFYNIIRAYCRNLTEVHFTDIHAAADDIWELARECPNLLALTLAKCTIKDMRLPGTLKQLCLSDNNIENFYEVIWPILPPNLTSLNIGDNPIDWDSVPDKLQFPPNLEFLKLSNTDLRENLNKLDFPDSIVILSLEVNNITLLDYIEFPRLLEQLGIGSNKIEGLNFPDIPPTVKVLHFTENRINGSFDLSTNMRGEELNVESLYLNYNKIKFLYNLKFPPRVKLVSFDECQILKLENITFQSSMTNLSFSGCSIKSIKNIKFEAGTQLQQLSLSQNFLDDSCIRGIELPESIKGLDLSNNRIEFSNFNRYFFHKLRDLKSLNLANNKIRRINFMFNEEFREVNFSFNKISSFNISFPTNRGCSKFKVLNLCMNRIKTFTPGCFGHNVNGTYHDSMMEIDLTENKVTQEDIIPHLQQFPQFMKAFFIGYTGRQDQFGYDIAGNILGDDFCQGKKIDLYVQ